MNFFFFNDISQEIFILHLLKAATYTTSAK